MKTAVVTLWALSLAFVAAGCAVAVYRPTATSVLLAILNVLTLFATSVVATWGRDDGRPR